MGELMDALRAALAIVIGLGIGYFWYINPPLGMNDWTNAAAVAIISIVVLFVLLKSIGKGS